MNLILSEIIKKTRGDLIAGDFRTLIDFISIDTRTLVKGNVYLALKGDRFDGHDFIEEAIRKGAKGIILEDEKKIKIPQNIFVLKVTNTLEALGEIANLWRNQFSIPIIGITGSNGKTTTKEMLAAILGIENRVCATDGNLNNLVGLPLSVMKLNQDHAYGIFEMGMNAFGEISQLTKILNPTMGLITNVGLAHLEGVKSIEGVLKAKGELFAELGEDDLAIINQDDERISTLKTKAKKISYGMKNKSDYFLRIIDRKNGQLQVEITHQEKNSKFELKECGNHFLMDWLSCYVMAHQLKIDDQTIQTAMDNYSPPSLRGEEIHLATGVIFLKDCYNANPDSMKASLLSMKQKFPHKRLGVVLGEMNELGKDAEKLHYQIGEFLSELGIQFLFALGEKSKFYLSGFKNLEKENLNIFHYNYLQEMKDDLIDFISNEDVVLVKGSRTNQLEKIFDWF